MEAVNPVVEGKAKCKQYYKKDFSHDKVLSIQIHGDASFAGQGVVYETVNMSGLDGYTTGGTIHVIINNQIGFTTDPKLARGGKYCTDLIKGTDTPIFHVNGDDPEAVVYVMKLATEWRHQFKKDVVVDLVCYRRHGHNEIDEPAFTQPLMYKAINKHKPVLELYKQKLLNEKVLTVENFNAMSEKALGIMEKAFEMGKTYIIHTADWLESRWTGFKSPAQLARIKPTGINIDILKKIGKVLVSIPEGFSVNPKLKRILKAKEQMFETGKGIDWATGEALAIGSLLLEGFHVRLAGQDVQRGTFSHRHACWTDQETGELYTPLNSLPDKKEEFHVINSCLSEYAALGFELGYSLESPNTLVMWEAQFGDFVNGAQIIIDQFLSCGEQKWFRQSGLTLLLPHGMEGQGPEHSSCRLERFLQLSDMDPDIFINGKDDINQKANWTVVNCSTPANYFHVLRQQIHREYRKPLIIATPKALLRHPLAVSSLEEFDDVGDDTGFRKVIGEVTKDLVDESKIRRLIFCSGKVYYDLFEERQKRGIKDVAIVRVEQLSPFPFNDVLKQIKKYPNAQVSWAQEEHKNQGAWYFVHFCLRTCLKQNGNENIEPHYIGRGVAASPATGSSILHQIQFEKLLEDAFKE